MSRIEGGALIVDAYKSGTNWYRLYSDNWCEQGGHTRALNWTVEGDSESFTLLIPLIDTLGTVTATLGEHNANWNAPGAMAWMPNSRQLIVGIATYGGAVPQQGQAAVRWSVTNYASL